MAGQSNKSSDSARRRRKFLIYGAAAATLALAGGAVWWFTRKTEDSQGGGAFNIGGDGPLAPDPPSPSSTVLPSPQAGFPLRQGSRGDLVRQLQAGLNKAHGSGLAVDGVFGPLTAGALTAAGYPVQVDQSIFAGIISRSASGAEPSVLAANLGVAVRAGKFPDALAVLRRMPSAQSYKAVSDIYKAVHVESVRKTVVNAMVGKDARWSEGEKEQARREFLRMGLIHDPSRDLWSLPAGLSGRPTYGAFSLRDTVAWDGTGRVVQVPGGHFLGRVIQDGPEVVTVLTPVGHTVFLPSADLRLQ